jgi:hypothetical protein
MKDYYKYKFGQILDREFTSEWLNPISKKIIYYHTIKIDTGDVGSVGTMEKNSPRIEIGEFIEYEIDDKGKIKIHNSSNDKNSDLKPGSDKLHSKEDKKSTTKKTTAKTEPANNQTSIVRIKGQEAFLGYAWSYSKDLIIAGKTMKDVEELNKVARYIYEQMGKMLMNE